jgi:hypothetical protein
MTYFEVGSESLSFKGKNIKGAFVTCFANASDMLLAIQASKETLISDGYEITSIDKCLKFDIEEWEEDQEIMKLVEECERGDEIIYSDFLCYS